MEPVAAPPDEPPAPPAPPPAVSSPAARLATARVALAAYLSGGCAQLRAIATLERLALAVRIVAGGSLVLAVLLAREPALDARLVAILALLALWVGSRLASRAARARLGATEVADAIALARPFLGDELRSFVELDAAARRGQVPVGEAFVLLLAERLVETLIDAPLDEVVPRRPARRALVRALAISVTGLGVVSLLAPRLLPELALAVRRGPLPAPASLTPPIIGDLELSLQPPAYTGLPTRAIPASGGDLRALRGTEVVIRARSLVGAVRKAELQLKAEGGASRIMSAEVTRKEGEAAPILIAHFRVEEPGSYAFILWRWTGRLAEPSAHRIELEPDVPPRLELRAPADPLDLSVPRPVELAYEVEDDFGISDVALVYQIGEAAPVRKLLTPEQPTPRRARGRFFWELGELERTAPLPAGAHISYWIEAHDNDGVAGPKLARSQTRVITLGQKPDPARVDRANLEALLEATLAALDGRLTPGGSFDAQHAALAALATKFGDVAHTERDDKKAGGATAALRKLATLAAVRLQKLAAEESASSARSLHEKIVSELEADALLIDDLRGRRRLEEMARLGGEMRTARDELKRLFSELKTATSDAQKAALRREIERKLTEIEAKMAELRRVAAQAEGEVPDEFLNKEAIGKQELTKGVDDIRKMLERGDMDKAMAELERMSRSLDKLTGALEKDLNGFRGERNPEEEKALSALENDLADLAKEEREVENESRAIRDRAGDSAEQRGGDLKALHDKLRGKLAELDRKAGEQLKDEHLVGRDQIDTMRARAQAVGRALDANDLEAAQSMALDARRLAQGMSASLRSYEQQAEEEAQARVGDGPSPSLKRSSKRMAEAESLARQIEAELQKAESSRRPGVGESDRRRLDELQQRQQAAQKRGDELGQRMGQADAPGMSGLPQSARSDVDGARQAMGESGRQLARPAPGRAAESAGQAAEKLESARKRVADARRGGESGGSSGNNGGDGKDNRDQEVRIPGADDSAAPRAFREELLDAMKRGAPRKFEDQVRQYYEELVR